MTDQNRKTLRSFYCRDYLYDLFEQMAQELGCSMDYLINESMRLYARSRDYSVAPDQEHGFGAGPGPGPQGGGFPGSPPMGGNRGPQPGGFGYDAPQGPPQGMEQRTFDRAPAVNNQRGPAPGPPQAPAYNQRGPAPGPPQAPPTPPRPPAPPAPPSTGGWQQGPQRGPGGPPPGPGGFGAEPGFGANARQPLYLTFNNNRYIVDKDKFVIGRGSQETDLTIRDGNISRKHCAVIFRNGAYFIKDLESTNGIEFRGTRIESKKVDEGDVFYLCDYELRFSYRG